MHTKDESSAARSLCRPAELSLLESLMRYFQEPEAEEVLVRLLVERKPVSLRQLDRFVSREARFRRVRVVDDGGRTHDLYTAYKAAVRGYHRQYFDVFARATPLEFFVHSRACFVRTTLAQLNFVRWVIRFGVLSALDGWRSCARSQCPDGVGHTSDVELNSRARVLVSVA